MKASMVTKLKNKPATLEAVQIFKKELKGVKILTLKGMGHFTHLDMATSEFPELLEEILK